jgi:NADH-quinone oxidoreductase subunit A
MEIPAGQTQLWPLAVYFGAVIALAAFMLVSSYLLGERARTGEQRQEPYESGIRPTGPAWIHFDVKYYLIAMFFVVFDVETIFVYAWAVSLKAAGWQGFVTMGVFVGVLLAALAYLWRMGALDWAVFAPGKRVRGRATR